MDKNSHDEIKIQPQQVLSPDHPRWREFLERLEGPEGCDFKKDQKGQVIWRCKGSDDKSLATAIMESMSDIDVPSSLTYFKGRGGRCDCEILFNIPAS